MRLLTGHQHHVRCVAYTPDGRTLASGSNDRTVRLWDVGTGSERTILWGHRSPVLCVAFAPDGRTLATSERDRFVRLWDVGTGAMRTLLATVTGSMSAYARDSVANIPALAFAPDGRTLAAGCGDRQFVTNRGEFRVWGLPEGEVRQQGDCPGGVWALAYTPDGRSLVLGSGRGCIGLYNLSSRAVEVTWRQGAGVKALAVAPDGRTIATAVGWGIFLWDLQSRQPRASLEGHQAPVVSLAFSPDGTTLASGSWDRSVRFWDADPLRGCPGRQRCCFDWGVGKVQCLAFAPDGMTAAAAGDRGLVLWDVDDLTR